MRQRAEWFACDGCDEETPHFVSLRKLQAWAKRHGWMHAIVGGDDVDYCPECQANP